MFKFANNAQFQSLNGIVRSMALTAFLIVLTTGCGTDKIKNDCIKFDKGFLEGCNTNCPSNCVEVAAQNKKTGLTVAQIKDICKESCPKHCIKLLENVRPTQCKPR